ncbi:hypothetical protein ACIP2Y_43290 [Streptomyces sviceus]
MGSKQIRDVSDPATDLSVEHLLRAVSSLPQYLHYGGAFPR